MAAAVAASTERLGLTTLLIRGFDPLDDAVDYGRHLLPLVRAELARRVPAVAPR